MRVVSILLGTLVLAGVMLDAFQTIVLPRRPTRRFRITRAFFVLTWAPWVFFAERIRNPKRREQAYSIYGPLSLLLLLALWAVMLVVGFGFLYSGLGSHFIDPLNTARTYLTDLRMDLYVSGTTLFTLGLGDVTPKRHLVRALIAIESGAGLGFMALVIGYVPVIYQAFSRREVSVALLDGRAGSPPTATELIRRHSYPGGDAELIKLLAEWERWSAEILESHISYPLLCYYRSQHDNQSWLSAMIAILDTCALLITTIEGDTLRQAQLTFAMARHALIDLGHVFAMAERIAEKEGHPDRMPPDVFRKLCTQLGDLEVRLCGDPAAMRRLTAIRELYEPQAFALGNYLHMNLPLWIPEPKKTDWWKTVAGLSAEGERALRANEHVSEQSTAAHLHAGE